jgi:hypothetical protein
MAQILYLPQVIKNAMVFTQHYETTLPKPTVSITDDQTEVILEWRQGQHHAILSIDDSEYYGYTTYDYLKETYIPGQHRSKINEAIPNDLRQYLTQMQTPQIYNQHWLHKD